MELKQYLSIIAGGLLACSATANSDELRLLEVANVAVEGGVEVISFDRAHQTLHAVGAGGRMSFDLSDLESIGMEEPVRFSSVQDWDATSVAVDPLGRGFVVCSWIPDPADRAPGMVQVLDAGSGEVVWQFPMGYHPDCVAMTPDGRYLIAANECEPGEDGDRAGGISIADISMIRSARDFIGFNEVKSYDFMSEHLATGVTIQGLRIGTDSRNVPELDIEPEYLAPTNAGVWVGLQENNGIAYFDFAQRRWTSVEGLAPLSHPMDASDDDGFRIKEHPELRMLPQPDTIAFVEIDGRGYVVLANEGEKDELDSMRLGDAVERGLIDRSVVARLDLGSSRGVWMSTIDGDVDGDGDIDHPSVMGGRSVSIMDAETGEIVWDSGEQFELVTGLRWSEKYNAGDSRSDRSGPEPEGIAIGKVGDRTLLGVGLERSDAVFLYDISDPRSARLLDAVVLSDGCSRPEGLSFVSMNGRDYLAVASEVGGCLTLYEIK